MLGTVKPSLHRSGNPSRVVQDSDSASAQSFGGVSSESNLILFLGVARSVGVPAGKRSSSPSRLALPTSAEEFSASCPWQSENFIKLSCKVKQCVIRATLLARVHKLRQEREVHPRRFAGERPRDENQTPASHRPFKLRTASVDLCLPDQGFLGANCRKNKLSKNCAAALLP